MKARCDAMRDYVRCALDRGHSGRHLGYPTNGKPLVWPHPDSKRTGRAKREARERRAR